METYIVQEGDNIVTIAKLFNVSIIDLINENNLDNVYYLAPGTELKIAQGATPIGFTYYTVKKGDNLYRIALQYNITAQQLAQINGLELNEYIFPNQKLIVPKEGVQVYITRDGDTIQTIIDKLGTALEEIFVYNPNIYILPEQLIAYKRTPSQE
ncbi:MAG: LysM peptidoglycan-binding domain-containing protein [Firmicutes bacterium]|nr:LysM peptidoglycan-binding domain-containing protein [Bacillota bacterium]